MHASQTRGETPRRHLIGSHAPFQGPKSKPKHYLALMLQSGKLRLVVRGRRRKEATVICGGRPGDWRGAMVRLGVGGRATLQAEGGERRTVRVGRTLLGGRLYVGGAPPRVVLPALPEAVSVNVS